MHTTYIVKIGNHMELSTKSVWDALIKRVGSDELANRFINNVNYSSYFANPLNHHESISNFVARNGMKIGYTSITMN